MYIEYTYRLTVYALELTYKSVTNLRYFENLEYYSLIFACINL